MTANSPHIQNLDLDHKLTGTFGHPALSSLVQPLSNSNSSLSNQNNSNYTSVSSPTKKSNNLEKSQQSVPPNDNLVDINNWDQSQHRIMTRTKTT